jgi:hypothetical protein
LPRSPLVRRRFPRVLSSQLTPASIRPLFMHRETVGADATAHCCGSSGNGI